MGVAGANLVPLAVLGVPEEAAAPIDLPIAYLPRVPVGATFREILERAAWGRR